MVHRMAEARQTQPAAPRSVFQKSGFFSESFFQDLHLVRFPGFRPEDENQSITQKMIKKIPNVC